MALWTVRFDLAVDFQEPVLVRALIEAEALARAIHGFPMPPYVQARLNRLNIARAVRGTTGIEGARLSEEEVGRIIEAGNRPVLPKAREREEKEARNAAAVMTLVADMLAKDPGLPLTEDVIRKLHEQTTRGIEYANNVPGQYRSHAVAAGDYVPPRTAAEVRDLMARFVTWLNEPPATQWPRIARAIAAHFYFISIHPFGDGNGRTARAVESFLLYQARVNALGFYSLANFYYRRRPEYIEMLDHVRFHSGGTLTPFLTFAANGLVEELQAAYDEVIDEATLIAFRDYARETLQSLGRLGTPAGDRMLHLVNQLGRGRVDVTLIRRGGHPLHLLYADLSEKTLARDLSFLEKHELLGRDGRFVYGRLDIMDRFKGARAEDREDAH